MRLKPSLRIYDSKVDEKMKAKDIDNGKEMGEQPAWN